MKDRAEKAEHLRSLTWRYATRSGEELKRGLPAVVRETYDSGCWKKRRNADGAEFASFSEWLITMPPYGCGLNGGTPDIYGYDELADLWEKDSATKDVAAILRKEKTRKKNGGDRRSNGFQKSARSSESTTKKSTLAARLAQEYPTFYKKFLDGSYGSIRSASEAAGLVKPGHDPLMRLRCYWNKANKRQRQQFLEWIKEQ